MSLSAANDNSEFAFETYLDPALPVIFKSED